MKQFDVYVNENSESSDVYPFLIILQNVLLNHLETIVVAPIALSSIFISALPKITITTEVLGKTAVILPHFMSTIQKNELKQFVENKEDLHYDIVSAIDVIFTGF